MKIKEVGLFFGTFNPIHIGHIILANHLVEVGGLNEVWFVITPQSPFKKKSSLLEDHHRYQMVYEATEKYKTLKPSKIEFDLPQPNYTINTLVHLEEKYPEGYSFSLIMGEDNLKSFRKWKNYEQILGGYKLLVYPRISEGEVPAELQKHERIVRVDAPVIEISSTLVRRMQKEGKEVRPLLPPEVWKYMDEMNFYR
jgi:nicotinate-nucleotide adenylyltransferase